jgi:hypothetical protein
MTRRNFALRVLCVAVILITTLPVLAAAVRGRPQGPYKYTMIASVAYQGQTAAGREKGRLNLSGLRAWGQSNDGITSFNLRFATRLTRANRQDRTARGRVTWDLSQLGYGISTGRVAANTRIQKTRVGIWKLTGNYTGRITTGQATGATLSGRFVAKSI